ncbi:MAG: carbon storage regulator [Zetaproteobacteria bacterium]|nr:MAG: carbon storage regulator [Zetaproteobacteria bacterium]
MMVVRRRVGEAIRIDGRIRVVVQEVRHEYVVRLGIDAPAEIPVHRLEIFEQIRKENRAASGSGVMAWLQRGEGHDSDRREK